MSLSTGPSTRDRVPLITATHPEVQEFLVQFFTKVYGTTSRHEALTYAKKLSVDGRGLYKASHKDLVDRYGINGAVLYDEIQLSDHGRLSSRMYDTLCQWLRTYVQPSQEAALEQHSGTELTDKYGSGSHRRPNQAH